jgi:hypothetical protein
MTESPQPHDSNAFGSLKTLPSCFVDAEHSLYLLKDSGVAGLPVYVQCFPYSTTNFSGLADWLKKFDEKLGSEVGGCGKSWTTYYCKGDGGHLLRRPKFCGHRHFCPNDADSYTRLRVNRAYAVLRQFAEKLRCKLYLIHIIFTFPEPLWHRVDRLDLFIKTVYDTLAEYQHDCLMGGVLALHLWHSKAPYKGWYPHVHVILLNVVAKNMPIFAENGLKKPRRKKEAKIYFVRKRPKINHFFLKARFKWSIKENFGYDWIGLPNVYVKYVKFCDKNEGKIKHLLRYAFRLPISDFKDVDFLKLNDEESSFVWDLLNLRFKRIRWFGFLADGVKRFYFSQVGVDFVRLEVILWRLKIESHLCPIHGIKMIRLSDYG